MSTTQNPPVATPLEDATVALTSQTWLYERHYALAGQVLRVRIGRNAYDHQSYAKVDVYAPEPREWNELARIPYSMMDSCGTRDRGDGRQVSVISYVHPQVDETGMALFENDEAALLSKAAMILGRSRA